jgi:SAM-dependent MidA family methyltransferase
VLIKRVVKDVDGNLEATLLLSSEQAAFLINMGLVTLVTTGAATVQDMTEEQFQATVAQHKAQTEAGNSGVTTPAQQAKEDKSFLELVDINTLPKA